jgi:alpha-methylacyl-CoA racemase
MPRGRTRRPLAGVRIVSLAQNLPGPLALSRLVAEGATAVKVEPPSGDPMREFSPLWYRRMHQHVLVARVDLKTTEGRERLHSRLAQADLLLTSQRPSALTRLGLGPRRLGRQHPRLRCLNIVGTTRDPERPGHDLTYQAEAGLIGRDMPRTLLADIMGAERAVAAALLLLRQTPPCRATVGLGDALDAAVMPLSLGLTSPAGILGGGLPGYRIYAARTGRVAIAALEPHFRRRLYGALGLAEGLDLAEVMRKRTAHQWERWAGRRDLPLVRIRD